MTDAVLPLPLAGRLPVAAPTAPAPAAPAEASGPFHACRLRRYGGVIRCRPTAEADEVVVRVLWARPVHGRGGEVALLDTRRREVALLSSLAAFEPFSRAVAEAALAERYLIAAVQRVIAAEAHLGTRYLTLATDRGDRRCAIREPARAVLRQPDGALLVRDTMGNRYLVPADLDPASRARLERIL